MKAGSSGAVFFAALLGLSLAQSGMPARAFSTFRGLGDVAKAKFQPDKHDGYIHGEITREAIAPLGFSGAARAAVVLANWKPDWDEMDINDMFQIRPNAKYVPTHHFDRNTVVKGTADNAVDAAACTAAARYVNEQRAVIVKRLTAPSPGTAEVAQAREALGRAFHALQDFFSHSNFVELKAPARAANLAALTDPEHKKPTADLRITCYSIQNGGRVPDDRYDHDTHCKDSTDYPEKARFPEARQAAIDHCRGFLTTLRDNELKGQPWKLLSGQ